ncbi:uncharacterized protein JCM6883_001693 [Sporobolomyces salmoneus]|uniref:uncharacterized protein n=1 Tax=Sporobolomyces salmoneus TaxID=183962 RepID=UPI0031700A4C
MTASNPPSPTKRILRTIVTGVHSTDSDTHAMRWNKQSGVSKGGQSTGTGGGARVRGLVDEYERSFSSKPYSAMPQASTSPIKTNFASSPTSVGRNLPILGTTQAPQTSSPSPSSTTSPRKSPDARSPTTVPASFFQSRQTPPPSPNGAKFLPSPVSNKENQPRPTFQPSPRSQTSQLPFPRSPIRPAPSHEADRSSSEVSAAISGISGLTLETMATRSSDSTYTSQPSTSSAELASVQTAAKVQVTEHSTPRKISVTQIPLSTSTRSNPPQPQIVQTVPTPQRPFASTSIPFPSSRGPLVAQEPPSPPLPPRSPCGSSFVEALPASYPSRPPTTSPLPSPGAPQLPFDYKPLPLTNPLPSPNPNETRPKTRARASTLGSGLKPSFASEAVKVESPEEKRARVEAEFDKLLDTMELPDRSVRTKMQGLAFPLKEEMLRSAAANPTLSLSSSSTPRPRHQRGRSFHFSELPPSATTSASSSIKKESGFKSTFLRKTKSNQSLRNSTNSPATTGTTSTSESLKTSHSRAPSATSILLRSFGKSGGTAVSAELRKDGTADMEEPAWWAERLGSAGCSQLSVKELGKLRGRLRNEAPGWVDEFIKAGGYTGMLQRLKELLEMEWREEQHDDQVLYELLRTFKALTLTARGKRALASYYPTPFLPIASLLFSEKRPGDLPCRQILVDLLASVFDICPIDADTLPKSAWSSPEVSLEPPLPSPPTSSFVMSPNLSNSGSGMRRYQRKVKSSDSDADSIEREEVLTPERIQSTHRFLISLMEGPPDEKEEAKVDFIKRSHRPRIFKAWVTEIGDCVRDYFWIFCHSQNLFWTFEQLDVDAIEAPKVPSGMTGGVEYEAMAYATAHLRLINAIARTCPSVEAAFAFHDQLFQSGFERVLFTLRRASLVYYQSLHLEMSRYISLARAARFNLGPRILSCLDRRFLRQEELMVVHMMEQREHQTRAGAPQIGAVV